MKARTIKFGTATYRYPSEELVPLGAAYPAPGYTEELLHFFFAEIPATAGQQATDDDERVQVVELSLSDVDDRIRRGEIRDAKTLAAWLLLSRRG